MKTVNKIRGIILLIVVLAFDCSGQTPVLPLYQDNYGVIHGAYYKDTSNDLDSFAGTWEYISGNTSLKILLQKKVLYFDGYIYEDILIGEYRYIENGVEKINTIPNIFQQYTYAFNYSIRGNGINLASNIPVCEECDPNQKRVSLIFSDSLRDDADGLAGEIIVRRVDSDGQQKIEVWLRQTGNIIINNGIQPPYKSFNVPWGKYVLTKVN